MFMAEYRERTGGHFCKPAEEVISKTSQCLCIKADMEGNLTEKPMQMLSMSTHWVGSKYWPRGFVLLSGKEVKWYNIEIF